MNDDLTVGWPVCSGCGRLRLQSTPSCYSPLTCICDETTTKKSAMSRYDQRLGKIGAADGRTRPEHADPSARA